MKVPHETRILFAIAYCDESRWFSNLGMDVSTRDNLPSCVLSIEMVPHKKIYFQRNLKSAWKTTIHTLLNL
ncbi:hypothetical protein ACJX0J_032879, partial [Zea mays]